MTAKEKITKLIMKTDSPVEPSEIRAKLGYSRVTVHKTLNSLLDEGKIVQEGTAPKTKYRKTGLSNAGYEVVLLTNGFESSTKIEGSILKYAVKQEGMLAIFVFYVSTTRLLESPNISQEEAMKKALLRLHIHMIERGIKPYDEFTYEYIGDKYVEQDAQYFYDKTLKFRNVYRTDIKNKLLDITFFKEVCSKYNLNYIGYFGSYAKGEETPQSDLDILVEFKDITEYSLKILEITKYLKGYFKQNEYQEIKIDVIPSHTIKDSHKSSILNNLIDLYGKREG